MLMSATTFTTQRQLMKKNMPATALDNPFAKQQKMLLYLMPLFFAISGINFPIGVLLYWLTTNLWSMGQQFYVIRRMPAPGSLAEKALQERRMKAARRTRSSPSRGCTTRSPSQDVQDTVDEPAKPVSGQRQQPERKKRNRPARRTAPSRQRSRPPSRVHRPPPSAPRPVGTPRPQAGTPEPARHHHPAAAAMPPYQRGDAAPAIRPRCRPQGQAPRISGDAHD